MTASNNLLFSWADVEQRPELQRLKRVLDAMLDGDILDALEEQRGHGRDDDPVTAMWRAMLAGIVFQHESAQSLLRELQRNPALLALCGFPALPRQSAPKRCGAGGRRSAQAGRICWKPPWPVPAFSATWTTRDRKATGSNCTTCPWIRPTWRSTASEPVSRRVGHDAPEPDVRRRFARSRANLPATIARAHEARL